MGREYLDNLGNRGNGADETDEHHDLVELRLMTPLRPTSHGNTHYSTVRLSLRTVQRPVLLPPAGILYLDGAAVLLRQPLLVEPRANERVIAPALCVVAMLKIHKDLIPLALPQLGQRLEARLQLLKANLDLGQEILGQRLLEVFP